MSFNPYSIPAPASTHDPDAPLYAAVDGLASPLGNDECVFKPAGSAQAHMMTVQVLQALDQCREFRSLDEHAAGVQQSVPGMHGQRSAVQKVLEHLVSRGLLISDQSWLDSIRNAPSRGALPGHGVAVRCCDRPEQFRALLESAQGDDTPLDGQPWMVFDDSRDPDKARAHRDALRSFASETGTNSLYIGSQQREALSAMAQKALPDHRNAIADLIGGSSDAKPSFTGGRSMNLAMLLAAGGRLTLLDDDQLLEARQRDSHRSGVDFRPNLSLPVNFHSNVDALRQSSESLPADSIERSTQLVGRSLGELIAHDEYKVDRQLLRGLMPSQLPHIGIDTHIQALTQGAWGSARTASNLWLFLLEGKARQEFWGERESYLANLQGAMLFHGADQARLQQQGNFTPLAVACGEFCAFAAPRGRGEDAVFAALTRFCMPNSVVLELPFALGHRQETGRKRQGAGGVLDQPSFNHFLRDFLGQRVADYRSNDPRLRLRIVADLLRDLAETSRSQRIEMLSEYIGFHRSDRIARLQKAFASAGNEAPIYWQADVRDLVQRYSQALTSNELRLEGWPEALDADQCADLLRKELRGMADNCEAWSALWPWALEQRERMLRSVK